MAAVERGTTLLQSTLLSEDADKNGIIACEHMFTLEVLLVIKEAQQQHGLRHGDYQRYRSYCSRRIRRLRKSLAFQQGQKSRYQPKKITEECITDLRFLFIPLMCSERCWSHAMQLKSEANTEPRKRFHMISRLRKAVQYVNELGILCEIDICDARTKLEVQAYSSWIYGALEFELQNWKSAMEHLTQAKTIYQKLGSTFADELEAVYHQKVEEISPSLRYCAYNIGDHSALNDLVQMRMKSGKEDLLTATLDELIAQTREKQASSFSEVTWRNRCITIKNDRIRVFLLNLQEGEKEIKQTDDLETKVSIYESMLKECVDSAQILRDELKHDSNFVASQRGHNVVGKMSNTFYLYTYLMYLRLTKTIRRNLIMIECMKTAENSKPQDYVRLYDTIIQNLLEISHLVGLDEENPIDADTETRTVHYKAFRCFYIGQSYFMMGKWLEALALYDRAMKYAYSAMQQYQTHSQQTEINELKKLCKLVEQLNYSCRASSIVDSQRVTSHSVSVKDNKMLLKQLDLYAEDSKKHCFTEFPPAFKAIPCKPLFFDLALHHVQLPSLQSKLEMKTRSGFTGFVTGLLRWGNKE